MHEASKVCSLNACSACCCNIQLKTAQFAMFQRSLRSFSAQHSIMQISHRVIESMKFKDISNTDEYIQWSLANMPEQPPVDASPLIEIIHRDGLGAYNFAGELFDAWFTKNKHWLMDHLQIIHQSCSVIEFYVAGYFWYYHSQEPMYHRLVKVLRERTNA